MSDSFEELDYAGAQAQLQARWPEVRIQPSLARMQALMQLMGEPQTTYPVVHLTGTNGKSSTARMVDALLREFGLRTGRYTSPHLTDLRERICLDGEPVDERRFLETYADVRPYLSLVDAGTGVPEGEQQVAVSFFEAMTAMAFACFADAPVDAAVVEVGMGGRWDATNVADGRVAVVTPVDIDHAAYLGETRAEIAGEKSGIVKPGSTLVTAIQAPEAIEVLLARAAEVDATVAREGQEFGVTARAIAVGGQVLTLQGLGATYDEVYLPLHGAHQAQNASLALAAVEAFFGSGLEKSLDADTVRAAFASVTSPGRLETVRSSPTVLLDAAHNPAGMRASVAALEEAFDFRRLVGVFAASGDKDVDGMLAVLEPVLDEIVVTTNNSTRSLDVDDLAKRAVRAFGRERVAVEPRLDDALEQAVTMAEGEDAYAGTGVLVTGSVYTAGDARILLAPDKPKPWEKRR